MSFEYNKITIPTIPYSAFALHQLVNGEDVTPNPANEGAIARYKTLAKAIKNAGRVAMAVDLHAFIFNKRRGLHRVPRGIGTVITGLELPVDEHPVIAHDVDYWLCDDASEAEHLAAASGIIEKSGGIAFSSSRSPINLGPASLDPAWEDAPHNYFATVRVDQPQLNRGFTELMEPLGEPGRIFLSQMPYGVDKDGEALQVYYGYEIIER